MKKPILIIATLLAIHSNVCAQLKNYSDERRPIKIVAEKTTLKVTDIYVTIESAYQDVKKNKTADTSAGFFHLAGFAASALPTAVSFIEKTIKEKIKKDALRYNAEYKCAASGEGFAETDNGILLPGLRLNRVIKDMEYSNEHAVDIQLIPQLSKDGTAFRYYIKDNVKYLYSIAKTKRQYDYIDLSMEIQFKSISLVKEEYKVTDLRTTVIAVPMIKVGSTNNLDDTAFSGWIPLPAKSSFSKKNNKGKIIEIKSLVSLFEIGMTITETNPYKIKAENKQAYLENSTESSAALLNAFIDSLLKKEEK